MAAMIWVWSSPCSGVTSVMVSTILAEGAMPARRSGPAPADSADHVHHRGARAVEPGAGVDALGAVVAGREEAQLRSGGHRPAAADAPVSAAAIPRRRKRSRTPMPPSSLTPSAIELWKAAPAGSPSARARCPHPP